MARTTILAETTRSDFTYNGAFDTYWTLVENPSWVLVDGQEYIIVWDGIEYVRTARAFTHDGNACVYVGNTAAEGVVMSDEPFVIVSDLDNGFGHFLSTQTGTTHTIAIYQDTSVRIVLKDKDGNNVSYEGVVEVKLPTSDGGSKSFVAGVRVETTVKPDFSEGDMIVTSNDGELFSKVTVQKPAMLKPENVAEGVEIGGVVGTMKQGSDNMPKLYAPTSIGNSSKTESGVTRKVLAVTNPTNNGAFAKKVQIVGELASGGTVVLAEKDAVSNGITTFYASEFNESIALNSAQARFTAEGFSTSDTYVNTSVLYSVAELVYKLIGVTRSGGYDKIYFNESESFTLTPEDGYYLPKTISVKGSEGLNITYTYDPDTGAVSLTDDATNRVITITVDATTIPWLRNPRLVIDNAANAVNVDYIDDNATSTPVSFNGTELANAEDTRSGVREYTPTLKASGASYGFTESLSNGFPMYRSNLTASYSGVSLMRLDIDMATDGTVMFDAYDYAGHYAYARYYYIVISKVDRELSTSTSNDIYTSHDTVYYSGYRYSGSVSASSVVSMDVPKGKHFVYIKFVGLSSSYMSSAYGYVIVKTPVAEQPSYTITPVDGMVYGPNILQAQSFADGCTESDMVDIGEYMYNPEIELSAEGVLSVTNMIPTNVTAFDLCLDDTVIDTIAYSAGAAWSVDMTTYPIEDTTVTHTVYIKGIGDGVADNQSNTVESNMDFTQPE